MNFENIKNLLLECYSKDLCYPKVQNNWNEDNKCFGMCAAITSLIINDYFGGDICKIYVDGISHYFNLVEDKILDLTSSQFNLPFYVAITLIAPTVLIFIFERIKIKDIKEELKLIDKKMMLITSFSWATMIVLQLSAYQTGKVTIVAPLCGLTVILNVIIGYIFLKEKDNLLKKIIAAILILISIILIKG